MIRYEPRQLPEDFLQPVRKRIAMVGDVKLEAIHKEHGRASGQGAVLEGKTLGGPSEQKYAADSPLGFARYPETGFIARYEEERD